MRKGFFTYFPPPDFLAMPAVGISINDEFVRVIQFKKTPRGLVLHKYTEKKVPDGAIVNGEIQKKELLVPILTNIKEEFNTSFARVSLPEEKAYVFRTDLPKIPEEAIPNSIEFKIQENVPVPPSECVFDYSRISSPKDRINLTVTVVPQNVVAAYTELFKSVGITPIAFKIESQAVARAIIRTGEMMNALIINFTDKQTGFYVVSEGVVQFSSTLKLGGASLVSLIQRNFKVSYDQALEMKRTKAFAKNSDNTELMYSISNNLSVIKDEISKVLSYWKTATGKDGVGGKAIEKIILCGEDVVLAGVDRYLSLNNDLPVEVAHVWENAFDVRTYIPQLPMLDSLNYAAAIGLALGSRKHIYV